MKPHDPYGPMLEELCKRNDNDSEELFRDSLRQTQNYVRELRQAFKHCPSEADYSKDCIRAAYLLGYYPYYIEPIYHVLKKLPDDSVQAAFNYSKVRACFLGGGAGPEILGWIAFLQERCANIEIATAYIFDIHAHGWRTGQEITRYHLSTHYWDKELILVPYECDMLAEQVLDSPWGERAITISNLFVMQNSLNEYIGNEATFLENFLSLFQMISPGSIFVLIDLNFLQIKNLMQSIEIAITEHELGDAIVHVEDQYTNIESNIALPDILQEELFTSADGLIPKKHTRFYSSLLIRNE